MQLGMIGVGRMGGNMTLRLLAAGHECVAFALKSDKVEPLQAAGGLMLLAGMATPLFGVERTRAVLAWEAAQGPWLIRLTGVIVIALGGLLTIALRPRQALRSSR